MQASFLIQRMAEVGRDLKGICQGIIHSKRIVTRNPETALWNI